MKIIKTNPTNFLDLPNEILEKCVDFLRKIDMPRSKPNGYVSLTLTNRRMKDVVNRHDVYFTLKKINATGAEKISLSMLIDLKNHRDSRVQEAALNEFRKRVTLLDDELQKKSWDHPDKVFVDRVNGDEYSADMLFQLYPEEREVNMIRHANTVALLKREILKW